MQQTRIRVVKSSSFPLPRSRGGIITQGGIGSFGALRTGELLLKARLRCLALVLFTGLGVLVLPLIVSSNNVGKKLNLGNVFKCLVQ